MIVLIENWPGALAEVYDFCVCPDVASKVYVMAPESYKEGYTGQGALRELDEGYGSVHWYQDGDIVDCNVLTRARQRVQSEMKYCSSLPFREAGLMPNRDKVDWEAAYAMQDKDKMFLLYAVSEGLCQQVSDFSAHFDGAVEEEVQRLVGAGFLMESDGRLNVTERGQFVLGDLAGSTEVITDRFATISQ